MNKKISLSIAAVGGAFLFVVGLTNVAGAAVQNATSTPLFAGSPGNVVMASSTFPVMRIDMNNASTTLASTTITVSTTSQVAAPTSVASSSFNWAALYFDADHNGLFDASDTFVGTTSVNINTPTVITPATTTEAVGTFFVVLQTSNAWTDNGAPSGGTSSEQIAVSIGTSSIVTAGGVATTTPTSTQPFTADTHSQTPATSSLSTMYSGGVYTMFSSGGAEEQGTINIYNSSSSSSTIATGSVSVSGAFSPVGIGNQYLSSVWVSGSDAVGNAESARVEYNLPAAPTVTSVRAFTDRIIVNASANLNGQEAMNCSNYLVNGSALNCGSGGSYVNFNGNQLSIMGLHLSQGASIGFSISGIQDVAPDQFPLAFSTSSLTVQASAVPTVNSVSPGSGSVGSSVTITGMNFGSAAGTVLFSGGMNPQSGPLPPIAASTTAWSDTSITATVPSGAQTGPVTVVAANGMTSDVTPNTIFYVLGNVYVKLFLGSTSTPITSSANMRIFIGGPTNSMATYYDGDGSTSFNASTYVYTIPNIPTMGFAWAYDASAANLPAPGQQFQNTSSTSPLDLVLPGAAAGKVIGTINLGSTYGANKSIVVMASPQGAQIAMGPGGVQPQFFTTNGNGTTSYAVALPANGTYNVEVHLPPGTSATPLVDPGGQSATISGTTTTVTLNFTYAVATRKINGKVVGANGSPLSDPTVYNGMFVTAYQPIASGNSSVAQPDSQGNFSLYANDGVYKIDVGGPNVPTPVEEDITVTDDPSFNLTATSSVLTIKLQPPTSYLSGSVKDGSGNAVSGADINAFCVNGPGNGHAVTDSQGSYKMYVPPCSNYDVSGFSQNYGKLADQTGISVSNGGSATVNFTLSSSNFAAVSGVLRQNGSALSGANIWITEGDFGMGIGGGHTDANGNFSINIQKGLSNNLYLHASIMGMGQIVDQSLGSVTTSTSLGIVNAQVATIEIHLKPMNTFSQVFLGAHSSAGGGYANTKAGTGADYDIYDISVPYSGSTTYTIDGGIPGFGPIPSTTTVVSGGTTIVPIDLGSSYYTVSGTVSGNYTAGAYIWAGGPAGGGGTQVNTSTGAFSLTLRPGIYDIGVNEPGYHGSLISQLNVNANTSTLSLSLTTSTETISGTVEYNGSPVANVNVWADSASGDWAGANSDANGNFNLSVGSGSYTLHAIANGYNGVPQAVSSPSSGVVLNLAATTFQPIQQTQSVSPTLGGTIQTSDTKLSLPQGMVSGSSNVQFSIADTMNTPDTKGIKVVGTGKSIQANYASGSSTPVKNLVPDATLEVVLTKSNLVAKGISTLADAEKIAIGYYNVNTWVQIPTTVTLTPVGADWNSLVSITLSGATNHFSTYAPVLSTSGSAPATPDGVKALAGNTSVAISWNSVSGASSYNIYRYNGSTYPYLVQTSDTFYTDTGLSAAVNYSYKVSALDANGNESAASAAVNVTTVLLSGGSGGGYVITPTAVTTSTVTVTSTATTPAPVVMIKPSVAPIAAWTFEHRLMMGSKGSDVEHLQEFLAQYKDIYPEGLVTGYFGSLTKKAVENFQEKYGIATPAIVGYGEVGPHTRAKLNELSSPAAAPTPAKSSLTSSQVSSIILLLKAFNVDQATIEKVQTILGQ